MFDILYIQIIQFKIGFKLVFDCKEVIFVVNLCTIIALFCCLNKNLTENKCKFVICILDLPFNISLNNCLQTFSSLLLLKDAHLFKIEELWEKNERLSLRD